MFYRRPCTTCGLLTITRYKTSRAVSCSQCHQLRQTKMDAARKLAKWNFQGDFQVSQNARQALKVNE